MRWLKGLHNIFRGGSSAIIWALATSDLVFLAADALSSRLPTWHILFEPLKHLSLAATVALAVVLIDHFVTIRKVASEVTRQIETRMVDVMEMFIWGSKDTGLIRIHKRLNFSTLFEGLGKDDELLWLDTYNPLNPEFVDKIPPALERGATIRMLIIDPRCKNAESRANEIFERETLAQEVEVFARRITAAIDDPLKSRIAENCCQILAYDDLPGMPLYLVSHKGLPVRGYSGFFLARPSAFFAHLEWTFVKGGVLENMFEYFEQKWNRHLRRRREFPQPIQTPAEVLQMPHSPRQRKMRSLQSA